MRRGLKKPLATAAQKRDLSTELDNFIRVCKFVVKDCGSADAVSMFSPKQDGYQGNLTRLAVEGSLPTIRGRMHLSTEQATQVAASIMMQRVGQTGKQNTSYRAFQKKCKEDQQASYCTSKASITTRGPPRWRNGAD